MNGFQKLAIVLIGAIAVGLCWLVPAQAGTYTMRQCEGAQHLDFQGTYSAINGSSHFDSVSGCLTAGLGKLGIYQDRSGTDLAFGEGGQFTWTAPLGTEVVGTKVAARLNDKNQIRTEVVGFNGSSITDLGAGVAHDGGEQLAAWSGAANPQQMVIARVRCMSTSSCENQSTSGKAFIEVTDVEFTVNDTSAPTAAASGTLWNWAGGSNYHRGSASITIEASDQGSGVAATWAEVNGLRVDFTAPVCPGDKGNYSTRFSPCPLSYSASRTLDTAAAPFQEGVNQIRLCARDYASTESAASKSCTATRTVLVDNQASNPPTNLRSDQGTDWQAENGFTLKWGIPAGQVAPVIGAVFVLQDLDSGAQVDAGYFGGQDVESAGPIDVPDVGAYKAIVYLVDGATNLGKSAETILRFDDRPPGNVSPVEPEGWISRDELPIQQEIERAEPGGPSGIGGYAMRVSSGGPAEPCSSGVCLAPEITLSGGADLRTGSIGGLSEGSHWITAAAVSGARKSSLEPGSTVVQVDRTPPSSSITGIPNDWVNRPVTVTVHAVDQLSGMLPEAGDDGEPKTVIAADNYAPYEAPGAIATFAVATEGVNRIRYWAEDLAGNANDGLPGVDGDTHQNPGQAIVRIDTTPPELRFDPNRDPEDPELVSMVADDTDSGVASASIGIRRAGSGEAFTPLTTTGSGGRYLARVPSDDLPQGSYELNATVRDRAGNQSTGNETSIGAPMILNLPVKQPSSLIASLARGRQVVRGKYGARQFVDGRLTSGGVALANQTVEVVETFMAGSRRGTVTRQITTDGDGRYRTRLTGGPSRGVEVHFGGNRRLSPVSSNMLRLKVKGRVRFRIKPRKLYDGGVVRMRGSVGFSGALPPARGKLVAIQYFDPSRRKWRPVEVLRTDRRGRFRYGYRFRTIASAQRIVFRASALPEAGWPYLPSTSKPRSVIVYPKD